MLPQTLPALARKYHVSQTELIESAVLEIEGRFNRFGTRFDTGWALVAPTVIGLVLEAQDQLAKAAQAFVPAAMEATGQAVAATTAEPVPTALVGFAGTGFTVAESLQWAPVRAKQAVEAGGTPRQAARVAGDWLSLAATTILSDTMRSASSISMAIHGADGYVRMVNGGACGRCVVLAGRWYRANADFNRHPRCKCGAIPARENLAGDWQTDPRAYFNSLTDEQQIKLMGGIENARAVRDGADMGQIVNAYRKTSGMKFAQVSPIKRVLRRDGTIDKFTTEGTTRRARAAQQQAGLRRNGPLQQRVMPQTIARIAKDDEDRMRLLKLYGWVQDEEATARGRAVLQDARRVERAARARERRAALRT